MRFFTEEDGTTTMEYGVISTIISLAAIFAIVALDMQIMGLLAGK